jgi:hypothetical protein
MPMEEESRWVSRVFDDAGQRHEFLSVTARCLMGHWYGGPLQDVEEEE